jgi:hypothetical protein
VPNLRRVPFVAAALHAGLFVVMWILIYWRQPVPCTDGPARWPFNVLFLADFPISLFAFGAMFDSGANVPYALAAWGTLGTFWWYGLARGIEFVWALRKRPRGSG